MRTMLVVVLCGFPASGKTTVAEELAAGFTSRGLVVDKVNDGAVMSVLQAPNKEAYSSQRPRSELYANATAEKSTRAQLLAATERSIAPNTAVLIDSLNYIKGFRYELYCVAKSYGAKYMLVYCEANEQACLQRDSSRQDCYGPDLVRALIRRFEAPEPCNRWDSPLFRVRCDSTISDRPGSRVGKEELEKIVAAGMDDTATLKATMATKLQRVVGADILNELDRATRDAEAALIAALHAGAGAGDRLAVPGASRPIVLPRRCKIAELRGMRRAHVNLARLHPPQDTSKHTLVDAYIDYVTAQLQGKCSNT